MSDEDTSVEAVTRLRALLAGVLDTAPLRLQYVYLDRGIGTATPEGKRLLEARAALAKETGHE
jgi:hypothetical protein